LSGSAKRLNKAAPVTDGDSTLSSSDEDFPRSPIFGITSFINGLAFIVMGVAIPYFISDGAFGAPIVAVQIHHQ